MSLLFFRHQIQFLFIYTALTAYVHIINKINLYFNVELTHIHQNIIFFTFKRIASLLRFTQNTQMDILNCFENSEIKSSFKEIILRLDKNVR